MTDGNTSQFIIYQTEDGQIRLDVRFVEETVWLSQQQMAVLFQTSRTNIVEHIGNVYAEGELLESATCRDFRQVRTEGSRQVTRALPFYNLDMIISVGYRVKSAVATRFRIWATQQLTEFVRKGFLLDDERLKNPDQPFDYFEELTRRIQDIRTSERRFYQKITDIYATSVDYDPTQPESIAFFQTVQNKMHWAITGQTAAEIIHARADKSQPNMGLTNWRAGKVRKADVSIAKNYLSADELAALNNLVEQYLIFAEGQALRRVPMHMSEWIGKLHGFLNINDSDILGDAYEYLIGQFAAGSGKKAGEFYTPQTVSTILSRIVTLDSQDPATGKKKKLRCVLDFACGSGSLLLNVRSQMGPHGIGMIYGQEKNITTYNLARMNMLLHGVKDSEFNIHHGDTLVNDWDLLNEMNPAKKLQCDAVVANPPFSYRWEPNEALGEDFRFKSHGLAPKSAADFAFLLHGFHFLSDEGTMAIILPHGVLFRGGAEARIRTKLLKDGYIDTVIGLPSNLFFSTGIPVCILVLKKCKKPDDVLFINASEHFEKGKRQNALRPEDIDKIVDTYQHRKEEDRYARRVSMEEIEKNDYNLNVTRYVSTAQAEAQIDLQVVNSELVSLEKNIVESASKHNEFLNELGLLPLP